jgi:nitronate monooxygenase
MTLSQHALTIGGSTLRPIVIGGMGVDISTSDLALEAARLGGVGHISDAMIQLVSDRNYGTRFSNQKSARFRAHRGKEDKREVKFDPAAVREASRRHALSTIERKRGDGLIFMNVMEKLTMGSPKETLAARLNGALDGGIDGVTLSAGLHNGSLALIADHPRFRDAKLGIIVSSDRALKIFLKSAARYDRRPDYIIVEGPLAGGHLGFGDEWPEVTLEGVLTGVLRLLAESDLAIPVIAAGGVFSGGDAERLIALGASAVQVATRFTVSRECGLPAPIKQKYFAADESEIVVNRASPTGYLMRMLRSSPCLGSNITPACEPFGYLLSTEGKCPYITAWAQTPTGPDGKKEAVRDKVCLCYHFSRFNCYTCGHNVYRLKDTSVRRPDGQWELLSAEEIFNDYLYNETARVPERLLVSAAAV